jgi:hypothetical protein
MSHEESAVAERDDVQIQNACAPKSLSAAIESRTGGKNVIDQNVMLART